MVERLSIQVTHASGAVTRWAADEPSVERVPAGLTFQTAIPGGFTSCTLTLPRSITRDYGDLSLFDDVKVLAPGGQVRWHGYVARLPREHQDQGRVQVQCVGWSGALKWDQSFREIYRDADLSSWRTTMSLARKAVIAPTYTMFDAQQRSDSVTPALATLLRSPWVTQGESTAWYDAKGIPLGALAYFWQRNNLDHTDTNWTWAAYLLNGDDALGSSDTTGNLRAAGAGYGYLTATAATRRFAAALLYHGASYSTDTEREHAIDWTGLYVYGAHGLTRRGAEPNAGFYASDIIGDVVARQCPFMAQAIDASSFIVPHAVFADPTDAGSVVETVNVYDLAEWGCWTAQNGAPLFFLRQATDELVWEARLDEGAKVQLEGDDASGWWNGVAVRYTDHFGRARTAGPTGYSLADVTSDSLLDTSESNPVNAHGLGRKWAGLSLSSPTTDDGAVKIGAAWLTEMNLPQRRGQITLTGSVNHSREGAVPVSRVRAGDWIKIADKPGDTPRRIVSTNYTHPGGMACDVGGMPPRVEAILERLGVNFVGRI